ncbi:MAG: hypothetical protein ACOYEH_09850 [Caldicoprobacterales bacterium]|jgi:type IV secretory pathway VirB2 component (pilin)|nr:zinc ribbon domain-containing protein [Clostridiales bacterium]
MSMTKCKICNAELKPNDKFCAECGAGIADQIISQPQAPQPQMSQASQPKRAEPEPMSAAPAYAVSAPTAASNLPSYKRSKDNTQLGVFGYVATMLALMVPILGIILVFVWAFGSKTNLARKNYCRAVLVVAGIFLVLGIAGLVLSYNALRVFSFGNNPLFDEVLQDLF